MKFSTQPFSPLRSEGTFKIRQPRGGWSFTQNNFQVPEERRIYFRFAVLSGRSLSRAVLQALCVWLISGRRFTTRFGLAALALLFTLGAAAETTNTLSEKNIQGRQLVQKLLEEQPAENFTNTGTLRIRDAQGEELELPVKCEVVVTPANWESIYEAGLTNHVVTLWVVHTPRRANEYFCQTNSSEGIPPSGGLPAPLHRSRGQRLTGAELTAPFAGSDFSLGDLGLEFLHWPHQKVLRGDTARGRLCKVLQSTNPHPSPNGYSRVLSWIDKETLGILEAKAYDAHGKLLKEFYPKELKKVNGQWQVGRMDIDNVQTGSRTRLELDLKN